MTIFLIGYMASGKTTLGRAFARATGMDFIDLDFYISQRFRASVSEIFASRGEEGFREVERNMLHEAGEFDNTVVSCGGGTPCFFDNMEYMNSRGVTVFLDANAQCIARRLLVAKTRRPIVEGRSAEELPLFIEEHLQKRMPFYGKAQMRIDSTELESREQIASTVAKLRDILGEIVDLKG